MRTSTIVDARLINYSRTSLALVTTDHYDQSKPEKLSRLRCEYPSRFILTVITLRHAIDCATEAVRTHRRQHHARASSGWLSAQRSLLVAGQPESLFPLEA